MHSLRKKADDQLTPMSIKRKSSQIEKSKNQTPDRLAIVDFNSAVSSPCSIDPYVNSEKKACMKKIRSTQDFNYLNRTTSIDSEISINFEPKKTKKTKDKYILPKINNLREDPFGSKENKSPDMILINNSARKKSRKQAKTVDYGENAKSSECQGYKVSSGNTGRTRRLRTVDSITNCWNVDETTIKRDLNTGLSVNKSSEKYKTANCIVTDSGRDPEIEINIKRSKKKQTRDNDSNSYIERIKRMLLNDCDMLSEENRVNDSHLNLRNSIKKKRSSSQICTSKPVEHLKHTKYRMSLQEKEKSNNQQDKRLDGEQNSNEESNNISQMDKICVFKRSINRDTCLSSNEGSGGGGTYVRSERSIREKSNTSDTQRAKSLLNGLDENKKKNDENSEHLIFQFKTADDDAKPNSNISNVVGLDESVGSDDVFCLEDMSVKKYKVKRRMSRMSTPFISQGIKVNTRRNASDINDGTSSLEFTEDKPLSPLVPDIRGSSSGIFEESYHNVHSEKEITVESGTQNVLNLDPVENDVIIEKSPSGKNISQNKLTDETSLLNVTFIINSPGLVLNISKSKCSMEMPSPIYGTPQATCVNKISQINEDNFVNTTATNSILTSLADTNNINNYERPESSFLSDALSTVDLTTPAVKKLRNSSGVIVVELSQSEKIIKDSAPDLKQQSPFIRVNFNGGEQKSLKNALPDVKLNVMCNSPAVNKPSVIMLDTSKFGENLQVTPTAKLNTTANIDMSKVTKRKHWDKSLISISFLDSPIYNIEETSAPWEEGLSNQTSEKSELNMEKRRLVTSIKEKHGTPPSSTSTPLQESKRKKSLLKERKNVTFNETKNLSKISSKPVVKSRIKMPNFALIHKRAYDKMENLKEMSERKAARAKLLLSGCKPDNDSTVKTSGKCKKFLQLSPGNPKFSPSSRSAKLNESGKASKSNICITKAKNIKPSISNSKMATKENKMTSVEKRGQQLKMKSQIPIPNKISAENKGLSRYGFKTGAKDIKLTSKEEQLKAVANKRKIMKNTTDERRNAVQGVRSNRRFELLMGLRKK